MAEGLSSGGTRALSRRQRGQERSSGRQALVMVQFLVRTGSRVCPGSEGPRVSGRRAVGMRPEKARVLVSHLCGC